MEERRKNTISIPLFSTFNIVFILIITGLVVAVIILYYSFTKKIKASAEIEKKEKNIKVSKFIDLPHGQLEEIKNNTSPQQDRIYYSILHKIFSIGTEFNKRCNEVAISGDNISFTSTGTKFHLGVFKFRNLGVISNTTHFFDIPLRDSKKKVYSQLVVVNHKKQPIVIHFFEAPRFEIKEWESNIKFCGVFYKTIEYENREGKKITAPLFLTYTVDKYIPTTSKQSSVTTAITLLIAILIIATFYILHKAKMKKLYLERLKNHDRRWKI